MTHSQAFPEDPEALLRDATWLSGLALALCSDRDLAEDLRQETLLTAWQQRGRLTGPLRPWLAGVMRRLAANQTRQRARRQRHESQAAPQQAAPATDEVVGRMALHQSVGQAVLALPEPYRTTLLLRYFDGLSATAIAGRQQLAVETVRTRIKRGVQQLRGMLDQEHGSRRAWLGPLAAVGQGVGTSGVGFGAASLGLVLLLMNFKILIPLLAVAGLSTALLLSNPSTAAPQDGSSDPDPKGVNQQVAGNPGTPRRQQVAPAATTSRLLGRVVEQVGGVELSGVQVELWLVAGADQQEEVARTRSDSTGTFALDFESSEPAAGLFELRLRTPRFLPMKSRMWRARPGATEDLGTCHMHRSLTLRGQVRDTSGAPVAGLRIIAGWRGRSPEPEGQGFRFLSRRQEGADDLRSDAQGWFEAGHETAVGRYWIYFPDPDVQHSQGQQEFQELGPTARLALVVHRSTAQIRGVLRNQSGRPLAGKAIELRDAAGNPDPAGTVQTDAEGRFVLRKRLNSRNNGQLWVFAGQRILRRGGAQVSWGDHELELVIKQSVAPQLEIQVVQAPSLEPVQDFALCLARKSDTGVESSILGRHKGPLPRQPKGIVRVAQEGPGTYRALVVLPDCSLLRRFELQPGQTRVRLVLPPRRPLRLRLVDPRGQAIRGSSCELLLRNHSNSPVAAFGDGTAARGEPRSLASVYRAQCLQRGQTDADGRLDLQIPALDHPLLLRIRGAGHAPHLRRLDPLGLPEDLRITLGHGAEIYGLLRGVSALADFAQLGLVLRSVDQPGVWHPARYPLLRPENLPSQLDGDGRFAIRSIPPGSWHLHLIYLVPGRNGARIWQSRPLTPVPGLREGTRQELHPQLNSLRPAILDTLVLIDGKAAAWASLDLEDPDHQPRLSAQLDADGSGRLSGPLMPGKYRIRARLGARDGQTGRQLSGRIEVQPGARITRPIHLQPAK